MDSGQLIRKATKMEVVHLNQKQLAARWHISETTLVRWRSGVSDPSS
jgi:DNA-binding transcriptional regulator YiaG